MPTETFITITPATSSRYGVAGVIPSSRTAISRPPAVPYNSGRRRPTRAEIRTDSIFPTMKEAIIGSSFRPVCSASAPPDCCR